jgi:hypothetical protein
MARTRLGAFLLFLACAGPAFADAPAQAPEEAIRATVERWYDELARREEGRLWDVVAPGFIDASPTYRYLDTGSRARSPIVHTSLPAVALKFSYDVDSIRSDGSFAKVQVWERGYFYAWAAQKTYERAAATTFVLERRDEDGSWRILAHQSSSQGIPPNKLTDPMPDLRALYYATQGKGRDPAADARAAKE